MTPLQSTFVLLLVLLALAAIGTLGVVLFARRQSPQDAADSRGPESRETADSRAAQAPPAFARAAPSRPRRLVVSGSRDARGSPVSWSDGEQVDRRVRLWRDSAALLFVVLLIAFVAFNVLPPFAPEGQVASETGKPKLESPLVVGDPSPSTQPPSRPSPTGATSSTPTATQGSRAPTNTATPGPARSSRPRPTPTPKPTQKPTPTPTPTATATPTPTPSSPTPTPVVSVSPSPPAP